MGELVFNVALGAVAEKVRDNPTSVGVLILKTAESDGAMKDRATITAVLAGSTEANFSGYARKTGITGTVTVDNTLNEVRVSIPDQTWNPAGGGVNNTTAKLVVFLDEGGTDATRIPLSAHDFVKTTNGGSLTADVPVGGFYTAT